MGAPAISQAPCPPQPRILHTVRRREWDVLPRSLDHYKTVTKAVDANGERLCGDSHYHTWYRMGRGTFDWLKRQLRPLIKTRRLSSGQRLAPTLRFLASGSSMLSVANELGMGHSTVHEAVHEVCAAIVTILSTKIRMPTTVDQLKASAAKFMAAGNGMPQCFAAVDGVHFAVKDWGVRAMVNRKGFTSYNVLALIDGDEQFINVEVGCPGSMHDARVMAESELADGLHGELGQLLWAARQEVNGCAMPMSILADSAYACHTFVLPAFKDTYAARCPHLTRFNTMHGPARRKIECTFGRVKARWRVLLRENDLTLPYVPTVIMACFILHNIAEQRAEPLPEADDRYMAMLAAYNAMFEGIELLGADEDGMGDNGGAAAAGGHLVPFGALEPPPLQRRREHGFAVRDAVVQRLRQM
ncbi:hypothetical protein QJQ45_013654 [Haematococcus lacustris]|nr:hypothetical protein QJQ45_013654 [Haematococcus lacustris]